MPGDLLHHADATHARATRLKHSAALRVGVHVTAFTETTKHNPSFARAHAQRGAELIYLGRAEEGIAEVEKAISISPNSSSLGMFRSATDRT